jgi:ATP-dependent exoDNAse (exonuclease V) alpha subunit
MKNRGASTYQLNNVIQEICNPGNKEKVYIDSQYGGYYLKVGDKVINTVNNYKTYPNIYNGNVGIVKGFGEEIDEKG